MKHKLEVGTVAKRAVFSMVRLDSLVQHGGDYWEWIAVIGFVGELRADQGETGRFEPSIGLAQEIEILNYLEDHGRYVVSAGGKAPGKPFANPPSFRIYSETIVITQSGGRDV
jgi:hypothetical protein